jgi:soluble cytochrome b562
MKEAEMEVIADFFKNCLIDGKYTGDEVKEFRQGFQEVHYSFDQVDDEADQAKSSNSKVLTG